MDHRPYFHAQSLAQSHASRGALAHLGRKKVSLSQNNMQPGQVPPRSTLSMIFMIVQPIRQGSSEYASTKFDSYRQN